MFRIAGNQALAYVRPEAVYRLAGTNVFLVSVSSASAFAPQDLESIKRVGDPEATLRLRTFLTEILPEKLNKAKDSFADNPKVVEKLEAIRRELLEKTGAAKTFDELYSIVQWLRSQGVEVKSVMPVETALDIDAADSLSQRQSLDPQSLMFAAAGMTQVLQEAMARYLKPQKKSSWLIILIIVMLAAALTVMLFMHG